MGKFKSLEVELEKKADKDKNKKAERQEAVENFKAELDVQVASLNSSILTQKRLVTKSRKAQEDAIYALEPNLEKFDKLVSEEKSNQKTLDKYQAVLDSRIEMQASMLGNAK